MSQERGADAEHINCGDAGLSVNGDMAVVARSSRADRDDNIAFLQHQYRRQKNTIMMQSVTQTRGQRRSRL